MSTEDSFDKYAVSPDGWGKSPYQDFRCPSGQLALVKVLGLEDLVALGVTREIDSITATAGAEVEKSRAPQDHKTKKLTKAQAVAAEKAVADKMTTGESLEKTVPFINKVVVGSVLKPKLVLPPMIQDARGEDTNQPDLNKRVELPPGQAYIDSVDFNDKMAIFTHAMSGMKAEVEVAEPFREGSTPDVGDVEHVTDVALPTE